MWDKQVLFVMHNKDNWKKLSVFCTEYYKIRGPFIEMKKVS